MDKSTGVVVGAVLVAIVAAVGYTAMNKDDAMMAVKEEAPSPMESKEMMKDDETVPAEDVTMAADAMPEGEESVAMNGEDMMKKAGTYEAYAPEKLALAETGDVVLFFHASWCPSCRSLNTAIEESAAAIPAGLSILKVDYDTATELKKKYGVTTQHTLVQVDAQGMLVKKWSGSPSLESLVAQVN